MKNRIILYMLAIIAVTIHHSCNEEDFVTVDNPNAISIEDATRNLDANIANSLVSGAYSDLQTVGLYGRYAFWLHDHMSDELNVTTNSNDPGINQVANYTVTPLSESTTRYYKAIYRGIFKANTAIDIITRSENQAIPQERKDQFLGEARFLRANYYFLLVTRFGGVPIEDGTEAIRSRSSEREVYEEIIKDLTFAAENLLPKGQTEGGRPSSGAAYAYLGKAYLFSVLQAGSASESQTYQDAFDAFEKVEGQGYQLANNYIDNVNQKGEYNEESMFEVGFVDKQGSLDAWGSGAGDNETTFISADYSGWGNSRPSPELLEAYEGQGDGFEITGSGAGINVDIKDRNLIDPRLFGTFWIVGEDFGQTEAFKWGEVPDPAAYREQSGNFNAPADGNLCSRKYSRLNDFDFQKTSESGVNPRIIRYADVLLMKAEACLFKNAPDLQQAVNLMNQVRARPSVDMPPYMGSTIPNYPVNTISEAFTALKHERQIEFAMEGKRLLDLFRWGDDITELGKVKKFYTPSKRFLPIPQEQLDTNPLINPANPVPHPSGN